MGLSDSVLGDDHPQNSFMISLGQLAPVAHRWAGPECPSRVRGCFPCPRSLSQVPRRPCAHPPGPLVSRTPSIHTETRELASPLVHFAPGELMGYWGAGGGGWRLKFIPGGGAMARASARATWPSGGPYHPRVVGGDFRRDDALFKGKNKNVHFVNQKYKCGVAVRCQSRLKPLTTVYVQTPGPAPPHCRPLGNGLRWEHLQLPARLVLLEKQT